jgi:DNA (cytosine-5)-methyltransferase 1
LIFSRLFAHSSPLCKKPTPVSLPPCPPALLILSTHNSEFDIFMQIEKQLDLYSGVEAGFCIAGIRAGLQLIGVAENDEYCSDILSKRFPAIPNNGDVKLFAQASTPNCSSTEGHRKLSRMSSPKVFGTFARRRSTKDRSCKSQGRNRIDVITASPPCQPFSIEGDRRGAADERDCFPAILQIVRNYQPFFAVFENVPGLLSCAYVPGDRQLYFNYVLQELSSSGYDAEWLSISSGHFTSPFLRERILLVAISRSLELSWKGTTSWHQQARKLAEETRVIEQQRGTQSGYPLRVVQNPSELARPLGVKSGDGTIRQQRKAIGNWSLD